MTTSSTVGGQPAVITNNASQLGHWLEEYGEIAAILPVLVGLLVTTRLQLRGGNALLVNIAIAAVTRQIIFQLKEQAGHTTSHFAVAGKAAGTAATGAAAAGTAAAAVSVDKDYTIVHSVPGRIRLRIPRLHSDAAYAKHLENLLLMEDIILSIRINRSASSLVIHYDSAGLSDLDLGMRLLQVLERAEQGENES